jgi:hypothetical protein
VHKEISETNEKIRTQMTLNEKSFQDKEQKYKHKIGEQSSRIQSLTAVMKRSKMHSETLESEKIKHLEQIKKFEQEQKENEKLIMIGKKYLETYKHEQMAEQTHSRIMQDKMKLQQKERQVQEENYLRSLESLTTIFSDPNVESRSIDISSYDHQWKRSIIGSITHSFLVKTEKVDDNCRRQVSTEDSKEQQHQAVLEKFKSSQISIVPEQLQYIYLVMAIDKQKQSALHDDKKYSDIDVDKAIHTLLENSVFWKTCCRDLEIVKQHVREKSKKSLVTRKILIDIIRTLKSKTTIIPTKQTITTALITK